VTGSRDERGTVTAFVAAFTFALLAVAGLVIDGGYLLAERQRAYDEADAAARAAAQAIDIDRLRADGTVTIEETEAQRRVDEFLESTGHRGVVDIEGGEVTVQISYSQQLVLLDAFGVGPATISAVGRATPVQAVEDEDVGP
jgi:Flp pilus assembly protein TadG